MPSIIASHRDFSGGQVNSDARRRDDLDLVRSSGRTMRNLVAKITGQARNRPGRRVRFAPEGPRCDWLRVTPQYGFYLDFSAGKLAIRNSDGVAVAANVSAEYLWTDATVGQISWCLASPSVVICFPGMWPQIAEWDSNTLGWSFGRFSFGTRNNTKYAPFVRVSAAGATMTPSAQTGVITLVCSEDYFKSSMIGRVLSIMGRQVTITGITDARTASATVAKQLPDWVAFSTASTAGFDPMETAVTETSKQKIEIGIVTAGSEVAGTLMQSLQLSATTIADTLIGESGSARVTGFATTATPQPVLQWTEEFMTSDNVPSVCFFMQNRLGFAGFPKNAKAALWSQIGAYDSFWVDASAAAWTQNAGTSPSSAILEYCRDNATIKHVLEYGDILMFTDQGVYQIPVSVSNPFKPGSIEFRKINNDNCSDIKPVAGHDAVLYVNNGKQRVSAIVATGASSRSFSTRDLSEAHSDLLNAPVAMALAAGDDKHQERFIYLVNGDGSVVCGRFVDMGDKGGVGWVPYVEAGATRWVTVSDSQVEFVSIYGGRNIMQVEDDDIWLDGAVMLNSIPAALTGGGTGPLWWLAGQTVTVMDGMRDLGDRTVSALGELVRLPGEDLSASTVAVGRGWEWTFEPFIQNIGPGQDQGQRKSPRKVSQIVITLAHVNGFSCLGRGIPAVLFDEDAEAAPALREVSVNFASLGRSYDPRIPFTSERPGPVSIAEIAYRVTV